MDTTAILIALGTLAVALGLLSFWLWRSRKGLEHAIGGLHAEVVDVAETAAFGKRLSESKSTVELAGLGRTINQLFDALHNKDAEMRQREALFRDLADTMPDVVLVHRERIIFANQAAADLIGVNADQLTGRPVTDLVRPAYRAMVRKATGRRLAGEEVSGNMELQLISSSEQNRWAEAAGSVINYRGREAILTVARDIGHRKRMEAAVGRGKQEAQLTLESIGEGVITTDGDGRIEYLNAAAESLTASDRHTAEGQRLLEIISLVDEADRRELGDPVSRCLVEKRRVNLGRRALMLPAGGEGEVSVELTASPIVAAGGELTGAVVIMHDVSELRGLHREISYQAAHDPLTGLINRREFERRVDKALESARNEGTSHVLCYLDLDRFKVVNDSCGHSAGDNLLREIAGLIREQVRESDFVARLGGDEFGMLLMGCPLDKAIQISEDVCAAVRDYRFTWQDRIFAVGVSVGLVEVGRESGTQEDLLNAADSACYLAKQEGRGRVHVYSSRDEASARQRGEIRWLQVLQNALRDDAFELFVQPVISVGGPTTEGPAVEVLLRLRDEVGELIQPSQFLKAAERYHLMELVDRWVVRATFNALNQGALRLPDDRCCSINLSAQSLVADGFLDFVVDCLDHSQVDPSRVCFEVSETAVLADPAHARRFSGVLHGMGCHFGLDDFGNGVGSFSALRNLSIDYLKIDGAYTQNVGSDSVNQQVVVAITRLARAVGFKVVAEQVEEQNDFDALRELGVDFVQGYFVERPHEIGETGPAVSVM